MPSQAEIWPDADWWRRFGSDELDGLIVGATGTTISISVLPPHASNRPRRRCARPVPALWPQLNLGFDASRRGPLDTDAAAKESGSGGSGGSGGVPAAAVRQRAVAALRRPIATPSACRCSASYEVDFWGKNRAGRQRSAWKPCAPASIDQQTVALTATTGVATTYLQILSLRDQIAIADNNLANARDVLRVVAAKAKSGRRLAGRSRAADGCGRGAGSGAGAAGAAGTRQHHGARPVARAQSGRSRRSRPHAWKLTCRCHRITSGLPSELLQRRPDIAQAEANLAAADANVVAARAAMYPSIDLSGALSLETAVLSTMFGPAGAAYSIAGSIMQPIFDGGKLAADEDVAEAQRKELIYSYRSVILTAFSEVENALGAVHALAEQYRLQEIQVEQADKAFRIVSARYKGGSDDLITLLDAQRTLFDAQDTLGQLKLQQLQATVTLYKALGGGWQDKAPA